MTDDLVKRLRKQFSIDETMQRPNFVATVYQSERDEAADRIEQLEANIATLKVAFRVNMLRANASHEEIDAVIRAALGEKKDG